MQKKIINKNFKGMKKTKNYPDYNEKIFKITFEFTSIPPLDFEIWAFQNRPFFVTKKIVLPEYFFQDFEKDIFFFLYI